MTITEAIKLQILWKDKECSHPNIEHLYSHEDNYGNERYGMRTGEYVCTLCGKIFSLEEYQDLKNSR